MVEPRPWLLVGFDDWITRWVRENEPSLPVILAVRGWVLSRAENPFTGARLMQGFDDYFFRAIPGSMGDDGRVATCTYWVFRADWTVRCDMISTTSWPV